MKTYEEALEIIREKFPKNYILESFEYQNMYVFSVLCENYKELKEDQVLEYAIRKEDGVFGLLDQRVAFDDFENYSESRDKTVRMIDKCPDDLTCE